MKDDYYLKDVCEVRPGLKSPVLFVLLGKRGKEAFPFLERTRVSMGDAIQMLQIADSYYRVQDSSVKFVDIYSVNWQDDINGALENSIIPTLKTNRYENRDRINVDFVIDLNDEDSINNLEEISNHIYSHLANSFVNSVEYYFYCFTAVKFSKDRSPISKSEVIKKIKKKYHPNYDPKNERAGLVFVVSDLNEYDVYSPSNNSKKYLAIALNTYYQAGYRVNPKDSIFDEYSFAVKHSPTRDFGFQAIGCAPLELNRDLLKYFFKLRITEYLIQNPISEHGILEDIFPATGNEKHVITKAFDDIFPNYYDSAEYIAYNQNAFRNVSDDISNRNWLRRIFGNNHQEYFENNVSVTFFERVKTLIVNNEKKLKEQFRKSMEKGEMNPFHLAKFDTFVEELEKSIHMLEEEAAQLYSDYHSWEDSLRAVNKYIVFGDKMTNRFRRRIIKEWLRRKRRIAIQEGLVNYKHMERDCILIMREMAKECQQVAEKYVNSCKNTYFRLEKAAFKYQTEQFDEYYSSKTKETMERHITEHEKKTLYIAFCKYMIDEKNSISQFNTTLEGFINGTFWRQADIKNRLVEEILDRMKATGQRNIEDVFTQLYTSVVEANNVDLRVFPLNTTDNDACCFMGPSDNMFISFLQKNKQEDPRIRVLILDQLTIPVALYIKFNIQEGNIII